MHKGYKQKPAQTEKEATAQRLVELLKIAFGEEIIAIRQRIRKSHISPTNMVARMERLMELFPDKWQEIMRSNTIIFIETSGQFEGTVNGELANSADKIFDKKLAEYFSQYPGDKVRELNAKRGETRVTSETVLFRIAEAEQISGGTPIPAKRAQILVVGSSQYNKWITRMRGYSDAIKMIRDNCPDKNAARDWIQMTLSSDARTDGNLRNAFNRLAEILEKKGPAGLRDAMITGKKDLIYFDDRTWYERRKRTEAHVTDIDVLAGNLSWGYKMHPLPHRKINGINVLEPHLGIGVSFEFDNEKRLIRKCDRPIVTLYMNLFMSKNKARSEAIARATFSRILKKKQWTTFDEIELFFIRKFAIQNNIDDMINEMSSTRRLTALFTSGLPQHYDYIVNLKQQAKK